MDVAATARFTRMSVGKARDLARKVQGLPVADALKITEFSERKAAMMIGKALKSAIANAEHQLKLPVDTLRVRKAVVEEGPRMKRWLPRARGSATPMLKRLCHVRIVLTDEKN